MFNLAFSNVFLTTHLPFFPLKPINVLQKFGIYFAFCTKMVTKFCKIVLGDEVDNQKTMSPIVQPSSFIWLKADAGEIRISGQKKK